MRRQAALLLLLLLAAGPLAAQSGREYFVQPSAPVDSATAARQAPFYVLRDSTSAISAAGARLMSDLTPSSSVPWMQARARAVAKACAGSVTPLADARASTEASSWPKSMQQRAQTDVLKQMDTFAGVLAGCQKTWTTLAADTSQTSLRDQAPYQMQRLQSEVSALSRSVQNYLRFTEAQLPPPGSPGP